jgi:nucleotide-binding universal stress UspA family protein
LILRKERRAREFPNENMLKSMLASLTGLGGDHAVLKTAAMVAAIEGGHIDAFHVYVGLTTIQQMTGAGAASQAAALASLAANFSGEEQQRLKAARAAFDQACLRFELPDKSGPAGGPSASWTCIDSPSLNETAHRARDYDLTVVAREAQMLPQRIPDILMASGRPVLVAPARPLERIGRNIALAWKPGVQTARALMAASPFLRHVDKLVLISVPEDGWNEDAIRRSAGSLRDTLRWSGISPELVITGSSYDVADTLRETAVTLESDLLIAGAYGHTRLREFVLGGVSRGLLADCALPLLLMH